MITIKFYLYYSHPAMCTDTQDSLTSWITTYNIRPCWSDLGSFVPEFSLFDFVVLMYFVLLLSAYLMVMVVVLKNYKQSLTVSGILSLANWAISILIWHVVICFLVIILYFLLSSYLYSPDLRHTVHSQLNDSLPRYNEDGVLLREAWDNTMAVGCCGLDGYQDFINFNMSIPSVCQTEVSPSYAKEVSVASNNKTFTSGCVEAVMLHIIDSEERRFFAFLCLIAFNMIILAAVTVCTSLTLCWIKMPPSILNDEYNHYEL